MTERGGKEGKNDSLFPFGLRKQRVALVFYFVVQLPGDGSPSASQVAVGVKSFCGSSGAGSHSTRSRAGGGGGEDRTIGPCAQGGTLDDTAAIVNGGRPEAVRAAGPGRLRGGLISKQAISSGGGTERSCRVGGISVGGSRATWRGNDTGSTAAAENSYRIGIGTPTATRFPLTATDFEDDGTVKDPKAAQSFGVHFEKVTMCSDPFSFSKRATTKPSSDTATYPRETDQPVQSCNVHATRRIAGKYGVAEFI